MRNCNQGTILALANGLILVDPFSAPDTLKNCGFFVVPVERNQNGDRLSDHFFGEITENPLCALVPTCDDAIEVLAYDCIITELDD